MFGLSLGEITLLLLVGIVVVGPKNLPSMMRTAGQWVTRLRRMSTDLRSQSGIDDLIRHEGLEREIQELRALSRMNVVDSLITPAFTSMASAAPAPTGAMPSATGARPVTSERRPPAPLREREYPLAGCDAYCALPDDAGPFFHEVEAARAATAAVEPIEAASAPLPAPADPYAPDPPAEPPPPNEGAAS